MTQAKVEERGVTATTPSGIEVYYQEKPKRLYRLRKFEAYGSYTTLPKGDGPEWIEVPSVTNVLGILDKPGLVWWGQKVAVEGVLSLYGSDLQTTYTPSGPQLAVRGEEVWEEATTTSVVGLLTRRKLTVNHVRDKAGDRGMSVHKALEQWVSDRTLPVVDFYPESEQGYVRALLAFLTDVGDVTKTQAEVMVGSVEHEFAGRYDLEAQLKKCELVVNAKKQERAEIPAGLWLLDAKTSSAIYTTQYIQLEAYEGARIECGYKPTKGRMIVRLGADGQYEVGISKLNFDVFLAILAAYNALESAKEMQKE